MPALLPLGSRTVPPRRFVKVHDVGAPRPRRAGLQQSGPGA